MVRTSSAGIKISSGKSSKKGGGGGGGGGSNSSSSSSSSTSTSSKSSAKGSTRLPPIPHQETPSWQKPITNFFLSKPSTLKNTESTKNDIVTQISQDDSEVKHTKAGMSVASVNSNVVYSDVKDNQRQCQQGNSSSDELKEKSTIPESLEVDPETEGEKRGENTKSRASVEESSEAHSIGKENETNLANTLNNQIRSQGDPNNKDMKDESNKSE